MNYRIAILWGSTKLPINQTIFIQVILNHFVPTLNHFVLIIWDTDRM